MFLLFLSSPFFSFFFFFNDTATTEIYTLSLHDALPISSPACTTRRPSSRGSGRSIEKSGVFQARSEEHTSELQSQSNLVCRLLLEKKKNTKLRTHEASHTSNSSMYSRLQTAARASHHEP